ncbi:hypothetical protein GK047_19670 [Paenibacillus sp. SYP-B3998]|uniref:Phage tail-like C-terminal domain-containing protein n=1 Tax=Paenibacillus sp. SYP-B3998 TaxID=2678564 RepID=A0A6G4A176_9BACL|nr:phage tail domain-containing protein [Paenibacillus sp. SYP-B3998]NEW08223.1 hypothetical protein [Paenibacillus sp. SYP-B3998]
MTIGSSMYFIFNGVTSESMGIYNVNMESGMQKEPFSANRTIKEQKIRGNDKPYFQEIELQPLVLTVCFAFEDRWDSNKIREVARWLLSPKYYVPLIFMEDDDVSKIYYCLCVDSPELIHNGLSQGYINLKFRCVDAYAYTHYYNKTIDLSANPSTGTIYSFENLGDEVCKPIIHINKIGDGRVSFINLSDGGTEFAIHNLLNKEIIVVDSEAEIIESNIPLTNRYKDIEGDFVGLRAWSISNLLIKGTCELKFTYQFKRLQ